MEWLNIEAGHFVFIAKNFSVFGFSGLGVDDMFVIIEAWNNLTALQRRKDLKVKIALAMQHAGVSITVTSVTDFVAFAIGATTVSLNKIVLHWNIK